MSDYSVESINTGNTTHDVPLKNKLSSDEEETTIKLKRNFKIVDKIKEYSINKNISLVAFKFTNEKEETKRNEQVGKLLTTADYVVLNDYSDRGDTDTQSNFTIFDANGVISKIESAEKMSAELERLVNKIL